MDELEISGKRYISSRRAGKEHKYHPDYIGQLVRAGKVAGQKVGRSWYVDAESLAEYMVKESPPRGPVAITRADTYKEDVGAPMKEEPIQPRRPTQPVERDITEAPLQVQIETPAPVRIKTEEYYIPVKISQSEEPLTTARPEPPILHSPKQGLRYLADDEPLFPAVSRIKRATEVLDTPPVKGDIEDITITPKQSVRSSGRGRVPLNMARLGSLAVLGVLALVLVAGGAYYLSYKMTIEGTVMSASISLQK